MKGRRHKIKFLCEFKMFHIFFQAYEKSREKYTDITKESEKSSGRKCC